MKKKTADKRKGKREKIKGEKYITIYFNTPGHMVGCPKLVGPILDAEKNSQIENSTYFLFKINRKGALGILEKKTQREKLHELKNLDPCISLDFSKLV